MGLFSFVCNKSHTSIPTRGDFDDSETDIVLTLPNKSIRGQYDGYGCINGVDIYVEVAKVYFGNENVTREEVFNSIHYVHYEQNDYTVDLHDHNAVINLEGTPIQGMTLNKLEQLGATIETNFSRIDKLIKISKAKYLVDSDNYNNLTASESCPYQGFFYDENQKHYVLEIGSMKSQRKVSA